MWVNNISKIQKTFTECKIVMSKLLIREMSNYKFLFYYFD